MTKRTRPIEIAMVVFGALLLIAMATAYIDSLPIIPAWALIALGGILAVLAVVHISQTKGGRIRPIAILVLGIIEMGLLGFLSINAATTSGIGPNIGAGLAILLCTTLLGLVSVTYVVTDKKR